MVGSREKPEMLFHIADGKVVYANRVAAEALGLSREETSSGSFEIFQLVAMAPEYLDLSQEGIRRRARGEEVPPIPVALLTRDGRRIEGILTTELVERDGKRELLGVFRDTKPDTNGPSARKTNPLDVPNRQS